MTIEEILSEMDKVSKNGKPKLVVITGGEPLLQMDGVKELIGHIRELEQDTPLDPWVIEIETNATVSWGWDGNTLAESRRRPDRFILSPKLSSIDKEVIDDFNTFGLSRGDLQVVFKFVVADDVELHQVTELMEELSIDEEFVYLMPRATTPEELRERSLWLVEKCKETGLMYSPRLQIQLWGNKRGK